MSPAFSLNSSHTYSDSLSKVKTEEVEEPRGFQEDAGIGTGGNGSMVEKMRCWVQLEQVEVVLKDTEQVQMSPGHMEETRPKKVGTLGELGPKHKQARPYPTEETPFKCWVGDCGKILSGNRALYDHKRVHHGYRKLKCKVEGCGSEFLLQRKFDNHRQNHQGKTECDECGKYLSKECLLDHKRVVHRGEAPFKCLVEDCDKRFSAKMRLADHKRVTHGFPKLKCKVEGCSSEFLLRSESESHHRTHKIMIECDECGKKMSANHLTTHKKIVHKGEKPYKVCHIVGCDKNYLGTSKLKDHLRKAHGFAKLKCTFEDCPAEFFSVGGLSQHTRTHSK